MAAGLPGRIETADMHIRVEPELLDLIDECRDVERIERATSSRHVVSRSSVVKNALRVYHELIVLGHTQYAKGDPRAG